MTTTEGEEFIKCPGCKTPLLAGLVEIICPRCSAAPGSTSAFRFLAPWETVSEKNKHCHFCEKIVETQSVVSSYWSGNKFACHKDCKKLSIEETAFICQNIDADCNDCKFFQRGRLIEPGVFAGHCLKFNNATMAYPNTATGKPCFEHRKS